MGDQYEGNGPGLALCRKIAEKAPRYNYCQGKKR